VIRFCSQTECQSASATSVSSAMKRLEGQLCTTGHVLSPRRDIKKLLRKQRSGDHELRPVWAKSSQDFISSNGWAQWYVPVIPAMQRSTNRETPVQASLGIKRDPASKITNASWAPVAHACNPSYSGDRDQEDCSSKPAPSK
jgi:hypothetical protein